MDKCFNLLDEPWIPVRMLDGRQQTLSLLRVLDEAQQIRALAESEPPSLIALYRLLLAITHRALSQRPGGWDHQDRCAWYRDGLPLEELRLYLERWRERFWLFHPVHPFMQVVALASVVDIRRNRKPWTQISLGNATGDDPTIFDHVFDGKPTSIPPEIAIRHLLGFLQFTTGKLIKVIRISDKAGPLADSAACMPVGNTLNETLCLALHPYVQAEDEDLPPWEKAAIPIAALRADSSCTISVNDSYTRLTRAVLLLPEEDGKIQWVYFAAGLALDRENSVQDAMINYRIANDRMLRLSFREGRAFWRDFSALMPDAGGATSLPAPVLEWALILKELLGDSNTHLTVLVAGMASNQAKLLRWRMEQVVLPLPLLRDVHLANRLRDEMLRAQEVFKKLRYLMVRTMAESKSNLTHKDTLVEARNVLDKGPVPAIFFSAIESFFPQLLKLIAASHDEDAYVQWSEILRKAIWKTWERLYRDLGRSPEALRAEARANPHVRALMRSLRTKNALPDSSQEVQA